VSRTARRGLIVVAIAIAVASLFGASGMAGPVLALVVGMTTVVIIAIRRPGRTTFAFGRMSGSPWLLLAIGMAVASVAPLVEYRLEGAGVFTTAFGPPVYATSAVFVALGLLGLLRCRAPGHAYLLMVGESLVPLSLGFLVWVAALQLHSTAGYGSMPVTIAIGSIAANLAFVAVAGLLARFDDDERSPLLLTAAALWLLAAANGLEAMRSWLGGTVSNRLPVAVAIVGLGVWLAATVDESLGAGAPSAPRIPGALGDRRHFVIAGLVLMTGPVLIAEYAQRGRIQRPMWMAIGTALVLALVISYLLRLAGRAGRLEELAQRDELTGVALRNLFHGRLVQALARSRREGHGLLVVFVDLDRFKQINDSLGHAAGNDVLRAAALRLEQVVGAAGFVGRVGGDEFTVFVDELPPDHDGSAVCSAIIEAFEDPFTAQKQHVFVTASVGAALYPGGGRDADTLLRNADTAMYKAKRRGRDAFEIYKPESNRRARDRVSIESRLHHAIDRGELRLHYQPKVGLRDGSIVGVEALLRWEDPREGLLLPGTFIHLAEESGLIVRLDEWALEEACRQAMVWQRNGLGSLAVAVNLSARDFRHRKVEDMVASVLRRTGLDPSSLELELTESLAKDNPERTRATLLDLKEMGVLSSIDDFGTGYSSLSSLATLPFDKLKIDKSFVERITDGRQYALITSVIALGHGLDLEVTAEGVETVQQMEFLQAHGCDVMQGFLFSQALPADELERLFMLERVGNAGRLQLLGGDWITPEGTGRPDRSGLAPSRPAPSSHPAAAPATAASPGGGPLSRPNGPPRGSIGAAPPTGRPWPDPTSRTRSSEQVQSASRRASASWPDPGARSDRGQRPAARPRPDAGRPGVGPGPDVGSTPGSVMPVDPLSQEGLGAATGVLPDDVSRVPRRRADAQPRVRPDVQSRLREDGQPPVVADVTDDREPHVAPADGVAGGPDDALSPTPHPGGPGALPAPTTVA